MNYRQKIETFFEETLDFLYPIRNGGLQNNIADSKCVEYALSAILIANIEKCELQIEHTAKTFAYELPKIKSIEGLCLFVDMDYSSFYYYCKV